MAITASGLFVNTVLEVFDGSGQVIDFVGDTIKAALFTNSVTPNFSTNTSYASAPYTSNQVSGTAYSAGGEALTGKTFAESPSGTIKFTSGDVVWSSATFSNARGALIWDDTVTTPTADAVLVLVNFGADFGVTAGTFTIQWAATGIFSIDLTP